MLFRVFNRYRIILAHRHLCYSAGQPNHLGNQTPKEDYSEIDFIKSSTNYNEFFERISTQKLSDQHALKALQVLYQMQKNQEKPIEFTKLLRSSNFEKLCKSIKRRARFMKLHDVITSLQILTFFGVSSKSDIVMSLLNLVKCQVNEFSLGQIVFMEFLLRKMEKNPLVDVLYESLPVLFRLKINIQLDHENKQELTNLLPFVNRMNIDDECFNTIVDALIMDGQDLTVKQANSIVRCLCDSTRVLNNNSEKLLKHCLAIIKRDFEQQTYDTLNILLTSLINKCNQGFHEFYDEHLLNKYEEFIINNDLGFEKCSYIFKQFNRVGFVSINLLNYASVELMKELQQYQHSKLALLFYVRALSIANHKPDNWSELSEKVVDSVLAVCQQSLWIPLAVDLFVLDVQSTRLWNEIFNKRFLDEYLQREDIHESTELLKLHQFIQEFTTHNEYTLDEIYLNKAKRLSFSNANTVYVDLKDNLELAFGGPKFVYTNVRTKYGLFFDHLIIFDVTKAEPIECSPTERNLNVFFDDLMIDGTTKNCVAVISHPTSHFCCNIPMLRGRLDLLLKSFEKMGIPVASIDLDAWRKLKDREKVFYLQREVKIKLP